MQKGSVCYFIMLKVVANFVSVFFFFAQSIFVIVPRFSSLLLIVSFEEEKYTIGLEW